MSTWILQLPVEVLVGIIRELDKRDLCILEKPVLFVWGTKDREWTVLGFDTKEQAKAYLEKEPDDESGYRLEYILIEGKQVRWKEIRIFDFVEDV